jgi:hypothetical protein
MGKDHFIYKSKEEAEKIIDSYKDTKFYSTEPMQQVDESKDVSAVSARLYFKKDLARMLNVVLAPDKIRSSALGEKVMNVKNQMTSMQFALSMFHAMTISQELTASTAAWNVQRGTLGGMRMSGKDKLTGYNTIKAGKEAMEISSLFKAILADPTLSGNEAFQKKADELLGTHDANLLDVLHQYFNNGGLFGHQDTSLQSGVRSFGEMKYGKGSDKAELDENGNLVINKKTLSPKEMVDSLQKVWDSQMKESDGNWLKAGFNTARFAGLEAGTQWLMEDAIPKVKFALFAREYTLKLDKARLEGKLDMGGDEGLMRQEIARDTMKFIEDRFGEVNWKNMWMDKSYKSALQFVFRSFTWFTGSWKALGKAGIDLGKLGWFTVKDIGAKEGEKVNYQLTEKGWWGMNALITHFMTAALVNAAYTAMSTVTPGDEVETGDEVPLLTKWMFPRVDKFDPSKRVAIPSYITELYKIMADLGAVGGTGMHLSKLISGRFNSMLSVALELADNENYRGVTIHNTDDSLPKQAFDMAKHLAGTFMPISASSVAQNWSDKGVSASSIATGAMGMTDAPAASKRSDATNKAFELRRKENKGKEISGEQFEERQKLKRAMYAYGQGDSKDLDEMVKNGEISKKQMDNAVSRIEYINGKKNDKYVDPLTQAFKGLTMEGKMKVWDRMSDAEKAKEKAALMLTYNNTLARQDKSPKQKEEIKSQMKELGLI